MREFRSISAGERWRRTTSTGADIGELERALATLPSIRNPRLRVQPGAIQAEMEGAMGALHEVSIHVPMLSSRIWPQVIRALRRSATMRQQLGQGMVPRAFDRLIARIAGEPVFPEPRRITSACTCRENERPCRHILALHEMFARRLDDRPWELLTLRGVDFHSLLDASSKPPDPAELVALAFDAREEPIIAPDGDGVELEPTLTSLQVRRLLATDQETKLKDVLAVIEAYRSAEPERPAGD
ncbi:MAG: SWIM zinc finger family protein [Planctomycetes bacterium]|nr:SWIM zinc finger family protein [Planctomycetota bacterium]